MNERWASRKQGYRLEDIRLLDYTMLKNMMAVVLAAAFFAAVWLGESVRRGILIRNITRVSTHLFGVPDFHYYLNLTNMYKVW